MRVVSLLQAWLSIPPKILPIRSYFRRKLHHIDFSRRKARDKSGVASQSKSISTRLAAYTSMRCIAPLDVAAGQPGLRPVRMHKYTDRKKEPYLLVWFFFLYVDILPTREPGCPAAALPLSSFSVSSLIIYLQSIVLTNTSKYVKITY